MSVVKINKTPAFVETTFSRQGDSPQTKSKWYSVLEKCCGEALKQEGEEQKAQWRGLFSFE